MGIFDKLFNSNKPIENQSIVHNDEWEFYSYEYEDNNKTFKALIEFDLKHSNELNHKILQNGLRLIMYINPEYCSDNGLPFKDTALELLSLQKNLIQNITSDSRFVAKMSYGYIVELVFQTNNVKQLKSELDSFELNERIIKKEFSTYKKWGYFDDRIKPNEIFKQKINERKKIEKLFGSGINKEDIVKLSHTFKGEKENLEIIAEPLKESEGFKFESIEGNVLTLIQETKLDIETLTELNLKIKYFSQEIGVKYLGWELKK